MLLGGWSVEGIRVGLYFFHSASSFLYWVLFVNEAFRFTKLHERIYLQRGKWRWRTVWEDPEVPFGVMRKPCSWYNWRRKPTSTTKKVHMSGIKYLTRFPGHFLKRDLVTSVKEDGTLSRNCTTELKSIALKRVRIVGIWIKSCWIRWSCQLLIEKIGTPLPRKFSVSEEKDDFREKRELKTPLVILPQFQKIKPRQELLLLLRR